MLSIGTNARVNVLIRMVEAEWSLGMVSSWMQECN